MRVIAGSVGGSALKTRKGHATRPTLGRVREALFSILGSRVMDASFLDLFAGTGAVGIEALSRGAKKATFVEMNTVCARLIRENLSTTRLTHRAALIRGSVSHALQQLRDREEMFDVIFMDPPYGRNLVPVTLAQLMQPPALIAPDGLAIVQQDATEPVCEESGDLRLVRQHRVGSSILCFYQCR